MGTTAYGGKGSKGRAANGDRPVGAASCRRDHHTMASCQNPLRAKERRCYYVGTKWRKMRIAGTNCYLPLHYCMHVLPLFMCLHGAPRSCTRFLSPFNAKFVYIQVSRFLFVAFHFGWRERVQGKGSEWRSASRRRQLPTRSSHHGVMPKPPKGQRAAVLLRGNKMEENADCWYQLLFTAALLYACPASFYVRPWRTKIMYKIFVTFPCQDRVHPSF